MIASGRLSLREVAARYPTRQFVASPTTPAVAKSATIRSTSCGSRSSASAWVFSASVIRGGSSTGAWAEEITSSARSSQASSTRPRSRLTTSSVTASSAAAATRKLARALAA